MASQGQKVLEARRRHEDSARAMQASLAEANKAMQNAYFEINTTKKLESRTKQERFQQIQHQKNLELLDKKQQLADLYNYERELWQQEVLNKVESIEDRKQRIMERAYKLRDDRESKRKEFVKECYDKQWRDACDDARTLDSQAMDKFLGQDRMATILEKQRRNQALSEAENLWMEEYARHCDKLEAIEKAKDDFRLKAARDLQDGLRNQMQENEARLIDHMERTKREAEIEIEECNRAIAEEAALQRKLKEDAYLAGKDVLLFNEKYKSVRKEEDALERQQDAQLLNYALRKEREAIAEEKAKLESQKHASQLYRKYLEEMMIKDKEDNTGLDEVRKAEENRIWKARDDVLKAREDARNYLMKVVDEGRQQQINSKREQQIREREEERIYSQKFLIDAAEGVAKEKADLLRRRELAQQNNKILNDQINLRRQRQEQEKQEEYLANKHMERIERLHRQKLSEQAGKLRTNFPVSSTKWYT